MSLFDAFTGDSAKTAAADNSTLYNNYQTNATGALSTGLTTGTAAVNAGTAAGTTDVNAGATAANSAIASGVSSATPYYTTAIDNYSPYTTSGIGATNLYSDALGLNGSTGTAAANSAYTTSPGYQFTVDQATDQATRAAAAAGMTYSGNTLQAVTDRAQNLANTDYSSWLDRLSGLSSQGLTATTAQGSQYDALGNMTYNAGTATGTNLYNAGSTAGQMQYGAGNTIGAMDTTNAQDISNVYGNATSGNANSNTSAANAETTASSNLWNGIISAGSNIATGGLSGATKSAGTTVNNYTTTPSY